MKHTKDMTTGNPFVALILFSLPIIGGNLFQHFYNLMDIAIVGNSLGDDSLAAVGATSALYGVFLCIAFGSTNGFSLVIAESFGAKNIEKLKASIAQTFILSFIVGILLTIAAFLFTKPMLVLLKTPNVELSYQYISIVLIFVLVMVCYNMFSCILRAVGNSVAPLIFLVISCFLNIGLDFYFICVLHLNVFGAGLATVISQLISCILSGVYLFTKCKDILPEKRHFKANAALTKELIFNGISMALMFSIVSIGSITLQYAVNNLGELTVAAHTTARKIDETMMLVFFPLSTACATYASQNLGAGKLNRIKTGILAAFGICFAVSLVMIAVTYLYGETLVKTISGSENMELIKLGSYYLKLNIPFYFFLVLLVVLRSTLQSIRYKAIPILASCTEMGGKALVAFLITPKIGYVGIMLCEPAIWFIGGTIVSICFFYAMSKFKREYKKP
ncbi:MAG: MATE family efflux transporter [Lachnospiraceae bacterium]|nr:MATE family efflux transporter [Lachnospiraceae bacterium]